MGDPGEGSLMDADGSKNPPPPPNPLYVNPAPGPSWSTMDDIDTRYAMLVNNSRPPPDDEKKAGESKEEPPDQPVEEEEEEIGGNVNSKIMCRDFARGHCYRRDKCKYRHRRDLSQLYGVYTFCRDFQNNTCKYTSCIYVHATVCEENEFYRTGEFPPHVYERVKRMEIPPRRRAHPPARPMPRMYNMPPPHMSARHYRQAGRIGVGTFARNVRPYYNRQLLQEPAGRAWSRRPVHRPREPTPPPRRSMCQECVDFIGSIDMLTGLDDDAFMSPESAGRVHALIMIVLKLRNAGIDISDVPEGADENERERWITYHLNNGLNAGLVYQIQEELKMVHPECTLSVAKVISIWMCKDLVKALTWRNIPPTNFYANRSDSDDSD